MTVGDFCKYLNPNDLVIIIKSNVGSASGYVADMNKYFDEKILHISADKYPCASGTNKNIGYEIDVT